MMIATFAKFFAAERTMAGPPMSICSMIVIRRGAGGDGLGERVQVADDEFERGDAELGQLRLVAGEAQVGEDAGVHRGVQRLHPAVERLREAGDVRHVGDRMPGVADARGGRAGGDDLDPGGDQRGGQLGQAGLVVDRDDGPPDRDDVAVATLGGGGGGHARTSSLRSMVPVAMPSTALREQLPLDEFDAVVQRGLGVAAGGPAPVRCAMTGPLSTPVSTTMTLAPVAPSPRRARRAPRGRRGTPGR